MDRLKFSAAINYTADEAACRLSNHEDSILPKDERRQAMGLFEAAQDAHSRERPLNQLFEEQVQRTPDAIAVTCEGRSLTYHEVNKKANQLARSLRDRGVGPDQRVGIYAERGLEMILGLMGILKAGGAYVPLDPSYPAERLLYILGDSAPNVLLVQERLRTRLPQTIAEVIVLGEKWSGFDSYSSGNLDARSLGLQLHHLAYVIYTSGSTGKPKGVMIEHGNVTRLFTATIGRFNFNERDVWTLFHSFAFDFSVWEIWGALLYGGRLVIVPHLIARSPRDFYRLICDEGVTVLNQTPSAFAQLIEAQAGGGDQQHSLRTVIFGGEALEPHRLLRWMERQGAERPQLVNMYGITETTVHATYHVLTKNEIESERGSLVGKPLPDLEAYILDRCAQPLPVGETGEIYIGGAGVARGYLNRPQLTAERFLADPFSANPQARMYKTGDLGRWRPDKSIEYMGRSDFQVKVRGFRIELGEIECVLQNHPLVQQVVVVAQGEELGEKRLVGYVVPRNFRESASDARPAIEEVTEAVEHWKALYEQTYSAGVNGPNFVGWNSSYNGQSIPESEMQEWLRHTVERIRALEPKRVLEIGCGVGLLLQHIAPQCIAYVGTDLSAVAVEKVRRWISTRRDLAHVRLLQRSAAELDDLPSRSFDTVVLNSVVQYFPSIDYLLEVLETAVRVLSPGGKIFLGDLRHLGLQQVFHSAVELSKATDEVNVGQLRRRITRALSQEKELVIDPDLFKVVHHRISGITMTEVHLKRGCASNELTRYRYDVVMHTGDRVEAQPICESVDWSTVNTSEEDIEAILRDHRWAAVHLRAISNARLTHDILAKRLIDESDDQAEVGDLRRQLTMLHRDDVNPDKFWQWAETYRYDIHVSWGSRESPGDFEALLRDQDRTVQMACVEQESPEAVSPWSRYANDPLKTVSDQQLIPQLREHLKRNLPEYMIPSAWMLLKQLPLTINGKLDRNALPAPFSRPDYIGQYVGPRSDLERTLTEIWEQVLQVDRVGVNDNFFRLGGHSLLLVQMMERLHRLSLSVDIRAAYQTSTLAELALAIESCVPKQKEVQSNAISVGCEAITSQMLPLVELDAKQIDSIAATVPGGMINIQDIYPLTPLQEGMLFHHLLDERGGDVYILEILLLLSSREVLQNLILALDEVIARHDVLRSAVLWEQLPQPVQVVYRHAKLPVMEFVMNPQMNAVEQLKTHVRRKHQRLNLRQAPLMCLHVSADPRSTKCYAALQLHHLAVDQVSMDMFLAEVMAYVNGSGQNLPRPEPYRNHVIYAREHSRAHDEHEFFRRKLADISEPTAPFGLLDVQGDGSRIEELQQAVEPAIARRLRAQARRMSVSPATLYHAAWALVVSHTCGRDDVVFGTVLLGRLQAGLGPQPMLGMIINTLPLRLRLGALTVTDLVGHVQQELAELLNYEQASLAVAQRCSGVPGSTPLFSTLLNYFHSSLDADTQPTMASGIQLLSSRQLTNYPITIWVDDRSSGFEITVQTDRSINTKRTLEHVLTAIQSLVVALEEAPETLALALPIISQDEWYQVVKVFNATRTRDTPDGLVHELFERQAAITPDAIAVQQEGRHLTYSQLNGKANQLARWLLNQGLRPNQLVGICLGRSLEMVVGLLGILKAGAVYLPLDPNYPAERLRYMLEDSAPPIGLTQRDLMSVFQGASLDLVALDEKLQEIGSYDEANSSAAELGLTNDNLVYVIYTSGSTGRPKGTAMAHRPMMNLIDWHQRNFGVSNGKRVLQFAALSFDVAFQEIFSTLCTGGTLVLIDEWVRRDAGELMKFLVNQSIQRLFVPPLMLQSIAEHSSATAGLRCELQDIIAAGEQLHITAEITDFVKRLPGCKLHNHYGPTETHVVTALTLGGDPEKWPPLPTIGSPIANAHIYVLGNQHCPVPLGVPGEIYVGGASVAQGYLANPDLTAARFIADPFSQNPGERLYKTGDLGRWREDGTLEYLGRNDDQVKIRGYRIELGEVGSQLKRVAQVRDAVVVARQDASRQKCLVAYVVLQDASSAEAGSISEMLRAHLKLTMPDYMVPSAFVILDTLPLTPNGKLDRRRLPTPTLDAYATRQYEAPHDEVEETLAGIWQELLQVERVGRHDNFFELGGHSLLMVQLMERLRRAGLCVRVREIYANPTLSALASVLKREATMPFVTPPNLIPLGSETITPQMLPLVKLTAKHIDQIVQSVPGGARNIQDIYPLTPLQEGILFHHLFNEEVGDLYVVPFLLSLSSRATLHGLIDALQRVMDRHDALRTAVLWDKLPEPVQVVYRCVTLPVEHVSLERDARAIEVLKDRMGPQHQRLDLRHAPPIRLQVAQDAFTEQWYALLQVHHMVCDHESLEIIVSEAKAFLRGQTESLPEPVPYRNHVAQALAGARADDAERFFRRKLSDVHESTAPFGLTDVHGDGSRIQEGIMRVEPPLAKRVRTQARRMGFSAATLFHAGWALVVSHTSGRDDVVFGSVLLGRLQGAAGAQRVMGMFINTLPIRLRISGVTAEALVTQTHRELVELLNHEQASLALAQRCSGMTGSAPLFTALFNYRHSALDLEAELSSAPGVSVVATCDRTNYPILLSVDDLGDGFTLSAHTDLSIDPRQLTEHMHAAMQSLVDALELSPYRPALTLPILTESERSRILESFNSTKVEEAGDRLVNRLFEEQVQRTPDAVAVIFEGVLLTYGELNRKANQLARFLRGKGVGPDQLVGICVERGLEMVVGLLGVLKAGGAYVPMDPNYPTERLQYMLRDAAPKVLLTQEELKPRLPRTATEVIALDHDWSAIAPRAVSNLSVGSVGLRPDNLAYVIYTSGSTGQPKGAMNMHRGVVNRLQWMQMEYKLNHEDRVLQKTPFSFDVSVWEFFWPLMSGACLIMARPEGHKDPVYLKKLVETQGVTIIHFVPSMLQNFLDQCRSRECTSLRHIVCSGEELSASLQRKCFDCLPHARLSNLYGPTEAAVDVTAWECKSDDRSPHVPIGHPISNVQMYVLDQHRQPAPIGVSGDIYIGGVGLGRGYLNRPELTAERFVPDIFSADPRARMYMTGDLGRWRTDGNIEYLGRNDHQVKIRGFRIELGEIEAQILQCMWVKEAVVLAREDSPGEKRLVAYVTLADALGAEVTVGAEELRAHLKPMLPEYLIPSAFVLLSSFPLTPNGKLDRRALPAPGPGANLNRAYEAPEGEVEEILASIWQSLLRVERVGRYDDFFDLGGHSLLATRVVSHVQDLLEVELPLRAIFDAPTVEQLAVRIQIEIRRRSEEETKRQDQLVSDLRKEILEMQDDAVLARVAELEAEMRESLNGL